MSGDRFKVNFLIVGTQKGGTTALANFLAQHPEICMAPCKEVHLFDHPHFQNFIQIAQVDKQYQQAFPNFNHHSIVGEATPVYMYLPWVAQRIYEYNPEMKLIFLLRNPVERAVSHYNMQVVRGRERLPFSIACSIEKLRLWRDRNNYTENSSIRYHSYIERGFYTTQILRMQQYFPPQQMLFIKTADLWRKHNQVIAQVYRFLNVQEQNFIPKQEQIFSFPKQIQISEQVLSKLKQIYFNDIIALEKLLEWDLTEWK